MNRKNKLVPGNPFLIFSISASGKNHMKMRMERERGWPCMKNGCKTDFGAKIFSVCGKCIQRFRGSFKQDWISVSLIQKNIRVQIIGQSKNHMIVLYVQCIVLLFGGPYFTIKSLTHRTIGITARIVMDAFISALLTGFRIQALWRCSADTYILYSLDLFEWQTIVIYLIMISCIAENILNIRPMFRHGYGSQRVRRISEYQKYWHGYSGLWSSDRNDREVSSR